MAKIETVLLKDKELSEKVITYVRDKYKDLKKVDLIVKECGDLFYVYKHINGSPLILNKSSF
jgi:hypothetical protein